MLVVYYAFPIILYKFLGIDSRRWQKIIFVDLALILNQGVFLGEIFRAAILSIPKGQKEAALACGISDITSFVRIILPQAVRIALSSTGLTLIGLFQDTSLVYLIGVMDILGRANALGATTGHNLESYLIIAFIFVIINFVLTGIIGKIDKHFAFESKITKGVQHEV